MAAHNWRTLRQRGLGEGIDNLMGLGSIHHVLDMIEALGVESVTAGAKTEGEFHSKLGTFYDKLYKPDLREALMVNSPDPVPPGFEDDEVEAAFDAFVSTVNGR